MNLKFAPLICNASDAPGLCESMNGRLQCTRSTEKKFKIGKLNIDDDSIKYIPRNYKHPNTYLSTEFHASVLAMLVNAMPSIMRPNVYALSIIVI